MTVKEFLDVVNYTVIDYAKIYEMRWNEDWRDYDCKFTDKRVLSRKDLEPYHDCELHGFDLALCYGEYDDSSIYIKMPKEQQAKLNDDLSMKVQNKSGTKVLTKDGWVSDFIEGNIYEAKRDTNLSWEGYIVISEFGEEELFTKDRFNKLFKVVES